MVQKGAGTSGLIDRALKGDCSAQISLGIELFHSDMKAAAYWFGLAALQGNKTGYINLGMYYQFWAEEQDLPLAVHYYTRSAEHDDDCGEYYLARCYEEGKGVERDIQTALNWYERSAEHGNALAMERLGVVYSTGISVERDMGKAVHFFKMAADKGNRNATCKLAEYYDMGFGVKKDCRKATTLWMKLAEQNDAYGIAILASRYRDGKGVEKDFSEASKLTVTALSLYQVKQDKNRFDVFMIGYCQYWLGEYDDAQQSLWVAASGYLSEFQRDESFDNADSVGQAFYWLAKTFYAKSMYAESLAALNIGQDVLFKFCVSHELWSAYANNKWVKSILDLSRQIESDKDGMRSALGIFAGLIGLEFNDIVGDIADLVTDGLIDQYIDTIQGKMETSMS